MPPPMPLSFSPLVVARDFAMVRRRSTTTHREDFARCLRGMRVGLSVREGELLYSALLPRTTDAVGARYPELVEFLRSNNVKWYDAERDIADKVGENDHTRRGYPWRGREWKVGAFKRGNDNG